MYFADLSPFFSIMDSSLVAILLDDAKLLSRDTKNPPDSTAMADTILKLEHFNGMEYSSISHMLRFYFPKAWTLRQPKKCF